MFGSLGVPEILLIMGLALLIFGPKRLPEVGRTLGRTMGEFRKASNDLRRTLNAEMIEQELKDSDPRRMVRDSLREVKDGLTEAIDPKGSSQPPKATSQPPANATSSASKPEAPGSDTARASAGAVEDAEGSSEEDSVAADVEGEVESSAAPSGAIARGSSEPGDLEEPEADKSS